MKVALPVVRGLHGSRTEGTTRRFKVGDFKTEFNGLGVFRIDIRTVPGRRRGDRIGERMSASVHLRDMPTDSENVRFLGKTGSHRLPLRMTRMTHVRHRAG